MSISRVEPTRAATSEGGAVEVRDLDVVGLDARQPRERRAPRSASRVSSARGIARARTRSSVESRAFRDENASPSWSRAVSTTLISTGDVEVADELLHDSDLLRVLLAEPRDLRADEVEQLQADGRDAAEVAGPVRALEPVRRARRLDPRREPVRVHLGGGRREDDVDAVLGGERGVAVEVARVRAEVGALGELRRVDEDARDQHVALGSRRLEQRRVAVVQRAHRRDEADDPVPRQVELADRARDDHGRVASASAS